jgi:hypothetical protein
MYTKETGMNKYIIISNWSFMKDSVKIVKKGLFVRIWSACVAE